MKTIDLFAGLGGNTYGAKMVKGVDVVWAANHNPMVIDYHEQNHPEIEHSCQDLQQADWSLVPSHDFMMASPCCQGHTKARGKEGSHHHKSRSTAWAPISCIEYHKPKCFMIENVTEMMDWNLFPMWKSCLETLGYSIEIHVLDSADFGVPQNRVRIFIIGVLGKTPLGLSFEKQPHVPFSDIYIEDSAKWSFIEKPSRAKATLERVKAGRKRFGDFFVMPYYGSGSGKTGRSVDRPIGTITTIDRWAIVKGDMMRMLSAEEYRQGMSFPEGFIYPKKKRDAVFGFGNATCPIEVKAVVSKIQQAI